MASRFFKAKLSKQKQKEDSTKPPDGSGNPSVMVVTAGLSRSGKSTALNNIFGTDFKSKYSPTSVTRSVDVRCVDGHEDELIVVDTPGLASLDIKTARVKKELDRAIGGLNFVLIYCHSVSPNSSIDKADENVVKNLQAILGKDIWKKCVMLFTFSDTLRHEECPYEKDRDTYKQCLDSHAAKLSELIRENCGSSAPTVRAISVVSTKQRNPLKDTQDILAIPVGKRLSMGNEEHSLVTGVGLNWRELAAATIVMKAPQLDRDRYKSFIRDKRFISGALVGIVFGAAFGSAGGAAVGLTLGGGFGAIPGAVIGAGAGIAAGMVFGGVVGGATSELGETMSAKKREDKVNKLKAAKHVTMQSPLPNLDCSMGNFAIQSISEPIVVGKSQANNLSEYDRAHFATLSLPTTKSMVSASIRDKSHACPPPEQKLVPQLSNARSSFPEGVMSQHIAKGWMSNAEDPIDPEDPE